MDSPGRGGRRIVAGLPIAWLLVFFLLPFGLVLKIELFGEGHGTPALQSGFFGEESLATWWKARRFRAGQLSPVLEEPLYVDAFLTSLRLALTATMLLLIIAYPIAYGMARAPARAAACAAVLAMLPFWTSSDCVYAWIRDPEAGGPAELRAARAGRNRRAAGNHEHRVGGADRARLLLSAVHAPSTLCGAGSGIEPALLEAAQDLGAPR